jgi:hypothetical protein
MRHYFAAMLAMGALVFAAGVQARDPIRDGRVEVKPASADRFEAGEFTFGKVELYGYIADLKDSKKVTGIVLLKGDKATDSQKHIIAITAKAQSLEALIDLGGKLQPLVDPTPTPEAPAPVAAAPAPAADAAPAAAPAPAADATPAATPAPATATDPNGH